MQRAKPALVSAPVAVLEHLTGPSQGTATWFGERRLYVTLRQDGLLDVSTEQPVGDDGQLVARLRRSDGTYEMEAVQGRQMWVNGRRVNSRRLEHHDMIEFSDAGPISRVYLYRNGQPHQVGVADIFSDAAGYLRSSRRPVANRLVAVTRQILRRLLLETTLLFRIGVTIALIALGLVAYQQTRINALLRQQIETGSLQLEGVSRLLAQSRREALTPADLRRLREELSQRLTTATERLAQLEHRSTAIARVISQSRSSILFLQGAYAFREKEGGRWLRHALGEDGKPLVLGDGIPMLTLDGDGPIAERHFAGTGFVLGDDGIIVTSRHVARPWLSDVSVAALAGGPLEPALQKFIAFVPSNKEATRVTLLIASKTSDLALLRLDVSMPNPKGLRLAERPPEPGEEVVLLGHPTGIRSMLAQAGPEFVKKLQEEEETDFWRVAARLAAEGRIVALASRGIVGRVSEETIVYDAETTYGGSGGPVLDMNGNVIAVNSAILPEYGGSNLGIPANKLRGLIAELKSL